MVENKLKFDPITYAFSPHDFERGAQMRRIGYQGEGRLIAFEMNDDGDALKLVVGWKGYGENPGSRYSGLYSYYNATTEVFVYDHTDEFGRRRFKSFMEWNTKPERRKNS